jgi:hypothetical protein
MQAQETVRLTDKEAFERFGVLMGMLQREKAFSIHGSDCDEQGLLISNIGRVRHKYSK